MEYSTEEDSSNPGKFRVKFDLPDGGHILFTQLDKEVPSQDEFEAWVKRYQEAASERSERRSSGRECCGRRIAAKVRGLSLELQSPFHGNF